MESNTITSNRLVTYAILLAVAFLALITSSVGSAHGLANAQLDQDSKSQEHNVAKTDADANTSSTYNNAVYFTSAEAEFEWNQFMVPDYDGAMIDPDRLIEGAHDTGRRLLEEGIVPYGNLRGRRIGD